MSETLASGPAARGFPSHGLDTSWRHAGSCVHRRPSMGFDPELGNRHGGTNGAGQSERHRGRSAKRAVSSGATYGAFPYNFANPVGINGAFYYVRLSARFGG